MAVPSRDPYPAGTGNADRPLDLAALCAFALVVLLGGSALARSQARAPGSPPAALATPAADRTGAMIPLHGSLTAREAEIVALLASGLSNDEIAGRLVVSPNTVKTHLSHAYARLGVTSRTAAVAMARAVGITRDTDLPPRGR